MTVTIVRREAISSQVIWEIISWIESDLSRPMSIAIVAEKAGYSKWYLQRLFKLVTGYSLADYIRRRRMTVAAKMLKNSCQTVSAIYLQIGFEENAVFTRAFHRQFGMSPTQYRAIEDYVADEMFEGLYKKRE